MDTLKEIQSATLCIIGMCTRMSGGRYNVADGIKRIHGFAEAIDDKITTTDQTIRDLRKRNCELSKKNWSMAKEIENQKKSLKKVEDELQSSQLSLSALYEDTDDDDNDRESNTHTESAATSQTLFPDTEDDKEVEAKAKAMPKMDTGEL